MGRVIHFEIHCDKPDRGMQFYQSLFGWSFNRFGDNEYWVVITGDDSEPGINGGLMRRRHAVDGQAVIAYVCTISVDDVDATALKVASHGGEVVVPKMAIPGVGWLIYCKDTESNVFGIMQNDPDAH